MLKADVIVVGGGPAGFSSAVTLAKRGFHVKVLEKKVFPREKVCGEFLSPAGVNEFRKLGVLDKILSAGAQEVNRIILYSGNGGNNEISLEENLKGLAMSRGRLDRILFNELAYYGVEGMDGCRVEDVTRYNNKYFRIDCYCTKTQEQKSYLSRGVVNASGLAGLGKQKKVRKSQIYGFKQHLKGVDCDGASELFFYNGGYGGLVDIENGLTCLAFQVTKNHVAHLKDTPLDIIKEVLPSNHPISRKLGNAVPAGKWIAMGSTTYGSAKYFPGICSIGDASGQIDPFTGLGMSLALKEGRLIGENFDVENIRQRYFTKSNLHLKTYVLSALLKNILYRPSTCNFIINTGNRFPMFGKGIMRILHG